VLDVLDVLDLVYLRVGGFDSATDGSIADLFCALVEMQDEGLIRHLGLSTVSSEQIAEARAIASVVSVQNFYNIANREDDAVVDALAEYGIAYVPYFPLGGFTPLQSDVLDDVAAHLRENIAAARLELPPEAIEKLGGIAV
jgi:pyridoxine 4-dehydrogenase